MKWALRTLGTVALALAIALTVRVIPVVGDARIAFTVTQWRDGRPRAIEATSSEEKGTPLLTGAKVEWFPSGSIYSIEHYAAGVRSGFLYVFHENQKLELAEQYANGMLHGARREYHYNGALRREMSYEDGAPVGTERNWTANGKLIGTGIFAQGKPWDGMFSLTARRYGWWAKYKDGRQEGVFRYEANRDVFVPAFGDPVDVNHVDAPQDQLTGDDRATAPPAPEKGD